MQYVETLSDSVLYKLLKQKTNQLIFARQHGNKQREQNISIEIEAIQNRLNRPKK
jgi:hypothetical protein